MANSEGELEISFGYQCNHNEVPSSKSISNHKILPSLRKTSSFSCFSGAALSANATLANTNICDGVIGEEILPTWDSPNMFRKVASSSSLSRLDVLSSSLQSTFSNLSCSPSTPSIMLEHDSCTLKSPIAPSRSEGFLNAMEVQVAGGAAGEDRVQAVCSEEDGWLFCAIYDGFNGRDAADFLAGTLFDTISSNFSKLCSEFGTDSVSTSNNMGLDGSVLHKLDDNVHNHEHKSFSDGVLDCLQRALSQVEDEFLHMVEQEIEDRLDLVLIGSCVLLVLIHGNELYTLNLGDSRAVLATSSCESNGAGKLEAIQLTDSHTVTNEAERAQLQADHPDDPLTIVSGRVKGKLKVTRAFGVGYLKKKSMNDALMGILRIRDLVSPPYISTEPSLGVHNISSSDHFVIVGSDGLFDFFSNDEAVKLVQSYIQANPSGDPAKFLVEQLVLRAADSAGFSMEELMNIPVGRRRKYHDDVTVIVIILGTNQRTLKASTCI